MSAERGGADAVELCSHLSCGGVTPSWGAMEAAREAVSIDLFVLLRPRPGDFSYSRGELDILRRDIEAAKRASCDGVALGVLTRTGNIDREGTRALVEAARPLRVTFHRAFDRVDDPDAALACLLEIGVDRVLTSGGAPTAVEGAAALARCVSSAGSDLSVVAAGSVNVRNCGAILRSTGVRELHAGSAVAASEPAPQDSGVGLGPGGGSAGDRRRRISASEVRRLVDAARAAGAAES